MVRYTTRVEELESPDVAVEHSPLSGSSSAASSCRAPPAGASCSPPAAATAPRPSSWSRRPGSSIRRRSSSSTAASTRSSASSGGTSTWSAGCRCSCSSLGALAGVLGVYANFRVLRGDRPAALKGLLVLLSIAAAALAYAVGVALLYALIGGA
jgi:hypothetical protein